MTKNQIEKEWQRIIYEIHSNNPYIKNNYFSKNIIKRELLLYAECILSKIMNAKKTKNKAEKKCYSEIYNKTIAFYYKS